MAPTGMDDVPEHIRTCLEHYSSEIGFQNILIIDTHNAMGESLNQQDSEIMISATKHCLNELKRARQHKFKIGFANSDELSYNMKSMPDLRTVWAFIATAACGRKCIFHRLGRL